MFDQLYVYYNSEFYVTDIGNHSYNNNNNNNNNDNKNLYSYSKYT